MATYAGFEVLETQPMGNGGREMAVERRFDVIRGGGLGAREVVTLDTYPRAERRFSWPCYSEADVAVVRAFVDVNFGAMTPFWLPSFSRDFLFDVYPGVTATWVVRFIGYTARVFPLGPQRRHVYVRHPVSGYRYRKVATAVDNGDGTETLTLDSSPAVNILNDNWMPGMLTLVRLGDPAISIDWRSRNLAICSMRMVEVPHEVPA